jgi:predicted nucleic acid-binding protein
MSEVRPLPLVLDANILIRAALGTKVRGIIERHAHHAGLFVPDWCVAEAREHLPALIAKRRWDAGLVMTALDAVIALLHVAEMPMYAGAMDEAAARLAKRDPHDADVLALALTLQCPIWTEDQDFFGTGVATWTSSQVERYLA